MIAFLSHMCAHVHTHIHMQVELALRIQLDYLEPLAQESTGPQGNVEDNVEAYR